MIERIGFEEETHEASLLETVRDVRTLEGDCAVYELARISLQEFDPNDLFPTALYVLQPNLDTVRRIAVQLDSEGVDIFHLTESYQHREGVISPPVVEVSDGVIAIVDGMHRIYDARVKGKKITCIFVEGAILPIVSYPVNWEEVKVYDTKPEDPKSLRKLRAGITDTSSDIRQYYRNLSALGSKGRRPREGQLA